VPSQHFVYIVRCADGTLYTGYTSDIARRMDAHNSGRGAKYTSGRRPVTLLYSEQLESRGEALRREHQLKTLRRAEKEALAVPPRTGRRRRQRATAG
jgi:putative endonuclease